MKNHQGTNSWTLVAPFQTTQKNKKNKKASFLTKHTKKDNHRFKTSSDSPASDSLDCFQRPLLRHMVDSHGAESPKRPTLIRPRGSKRNTAVAHMLATERGRLNTNNPGEGIVFYNTVEAISS